MTATQPRGAPARAAGAVARNPLAPLATLAARRFAAQRPHAARAGRAAAHPDPVRARHRAGARSRRSHTQRLDYEAFVAIGTIGLLIPLNTMFAGIGVIVDRESGAQRELLAAPIRAVAARARQPRRRVRDHRAAARRADRRRRSRAASTSSHRRPASLWFVAAAGAASPSACTAWPRRSPAACPEPEEYIGARCPAIAIVPVVPRRLAVPDQRAARRPRPGSRSPARSRTRSR